MALDTEIQQLANEFKQRLIQHLGAHVLEVRLFGSRARGDARPDSDLDFFVMLDDDDWRLREQAWAIAKDIEFEKQLDVAMQALTMSRERFAELLRRERLIARDIVEQGIIV